MKDEEKKLIEDLFYRLKKTELNSSERDISADNLIKQLVHSQPAAPYYMTQTILIQETAIKQMNLKIEELTKEINSLKTEAMDKKPSFLSNLFTKNSTSPTIAHDHDIWKKKENVLHNNNSNPNISSNAQTLPILNSSRNGGFLSNALQTATGVAGGMILGNILMNIFNYSRSEEDMFNSVDKSSMHHSHTGENYFSSNSMNANNLIDYEHNESDINLDNSNVDDTNYLHDSYDTDANDDNFI